MGRPRVYDYEKIRRMLAQGYSHETVMRGLGCDKSVVRKAVIEGAALAAAAKRAAEASAPEPEPQPQPRRAYNNRPSMRTVKPEDVDFTDYNTGLADERRTKDAGARGCQSLLDALRKHHREGHGELNIKSTGRAEYIAPAPSLIGGGSPAAACIEA